MALPHPQLQDRDWRSMSPGQPVFETADGRGLIAEGMDDGIPVFVNEAAYAEKRIAFSLTKREVLTVEPAWLQALVNLLRSDQVQPQAQVPLLLSFRTSGPRAAGGSGGRL